MMSSRQSVIRVSQWKRASLRLFLVVCLFGIWGLQAPTARGQTSITSPTGAEVECQNGTADGYPCENVDLLSFLSIDDLGGTSGTEINDVWGWTDPETGTEYALVGRTDGVAFVDVSTPTDPVYIGELPTHSSSSTWRDVKVYEDHAFIVSEAFDHGMQVFDLTQLGDVPSEEQPKTFSETVHYDEVGTIHNIVVNQDTGFAYIVGGSGGTNACGGGLHMVNIQNPTSPTFAGCFSQAGYTHDAQCVVYDGPDTEHQGDEICFNGNEDILNIADVTDKGNPTKIANATYPLIGYVHQAWLTDDHKYLYVDDELDESQGLVDQTRTLVFDVTNLESPELVKTYNGPTGAIDHNQYIEDGYSYQANYQAGLRILDVSDPEAPSEVGYFDTYPSGNAASFDGAWSTYPFFEDNMVLISSIGEGLFVVQPELTQTESTIVQFSSSSRTVAEDGGSVTLTVELAQVDPTASIEVDVAFNSEASSAGADDLDYTTQTVSFPATASIGDTKEVTVGVADDGSVEGNEDAQFDLENLNTSGSGEVGGASASTVTIVDDDRTVADAREALANGTAEEVILEGTVSRAYGHSVRLQDRSGPTGASGLVVRQTAGFMSDEFQQDIEDRTIRPGTQLRVRGVPSAPNGQVRFNNDDLVRYAVQGQGEPPAPQSVSLSTLASSAEDYESERVEVRGISFPNVSSDASFAAETSYEVTDGEETFAFRVGGEEESALVGAPIPTGVFAFDDVVGQSGDGSGGDHHLFGIRPPTSLPDPIVRFVSDSMAVPEDSGAVSLAVELAQSAPTASIEVDVAFDRTASTASDDDIGNYLSETVSFAASDTSGTTASVTVPLTDEDIREGNEQARFVLTNLQTTGSASVGAPDEADLTIVGDDRTVADARKALENEHEEEVILEGTVSRAFGSTVRVQDASGPTGASAVVVRQTDGTTSGAFQAAIEDGTIQAGTQLRVRGTLSASNGLVRIHNEDLTSYTVQEQGSPPSPQDVTLEDVMGPDGEDYESELLRISGLTFPEASGPFAAGTTYDVSDGEHSIPFHVQDSTASALPGLRIPTGTFVYEGVLGQANGGEGDTGYRLTPIRPNTALPVEIAAFEAVENGASIELTWQTVSETNNEGFRVQYRAPATDSWTGLGFVESNDEDGTSAQGHSYHYRVDRELEPGTHRFRLQQEDLDGSTAASHVATVEVPMDEAVRLGTPGPNPASERVSLSYSVKEATEATIALYNVLGQRVETLYKGRPKTEQRHTLNFGVDRLPSGVYFIRLQAGGRTRTERLTVLR